ncbi:tryptophan 2,3-dioxygenase [Phreatobacter sp. AB_2022a]|uniref:tryptophan 2,3-dioxygenase n=1 Tax=Phreatobacter sp. AB_2022a TaxID=3003134 RepID=UPI00056EB7A0|nr:tryptophan 2,3-dioxygenase [Phreatobacter sp. AB_2022a]MCZ0733806.1 tryptophan 2,3-dioxygenase [Phreatobacter sp. AB_2022a]CEJ12417.1 Tryptophan 2,3-dioxygenase [bacterium YEK0313]
MSTRQKHDPKADGLKGAHLDFAHEMGYGDYLELDTLLSAQNLRSDKHDEMLFIIQHQTSELWIRLLLHELTAARDCIRRDELDPSFKMLARVSRVMDQLVSAWTVLSTLTPSEYTEFRGVLGRSSGFQSHQYRVLEFLLGNKNPVLARPHAHHPVRNAEVMAALEAPSIYDESLRLVARRGFAIDAAVTGRDWREPYRANASVLEAWRQIYAAPKAHWDLYQLAEKLVDIEDSFRQWRYRHVTTVQRIIGFKQGTGGTSGVGYLQSVLQLELFPELWQVRTYL